MKPTLRFFPQIAISLLLTMAGASALAQGLTMPRVTETYIGANLMMDVDQRVQGNGATGNFQQRNVDRANAFMVRWGYREERTYGIELGYQMIPNWRATSDTGVAYQQKGQGFFADLFVFFPLTNQASIYLKMGAARLKSTSTIETPGTQNGQRVVFYSQTEENKTLPTLGVGVEYLLNPGFAVRGGWESIKIKSSNGPSATHSGFNVGGLMFYE